MAERRNIDWGQSPFEQWEIVTVEWQADAQNQRIPHSLNPENPRDVRYILIRADRQMDLEDDQNSSLYSTNQWTRDSIVLKAHFTPGDDNSCDLLLFVPRRGVTQR